MNPDIINGLLEFGGAVALALDIRCLIRDKEVKGVYWPAKLFFLTWGVWNLYFYSFYDHAWSWWGGLAICVMNATWAFLAWRYTKRINNDYVRLIDQVCIHEGFEKVINRR